MGRLLDEEIAVISEKKLTTLLKNWQQPGDRPKKRLSSLSHRGVTAKPSGRCTIWRKKRPQPDCLSPVAVLLAELNKRFVIDNCLRSIIREKHFIILLIRKQSRSNSPPN